MFAFQSQLGGSKQRPITSGPASQMNKTLSFDYHSHLIEKQSIQSGKLDFQQFKKVLEILANKVVVG